MMNYRRYNNDIDYEKLCDWLASLDWPVIPQESIPPCGIVVMDGEEPVAITFIYAAEYEDSDFIYPGWIVFNSEIKYKKILDAMNIIANAYDDIARENNKTHIQITMKTASLINYLCKKHDYKKAETNVTRLVKYLDQETEEDGIFWYDQEGIDEYFPSSKFATKQE